jgi:hypothetical protein
MGRAEWRLMTVLRNVIACHSLPYCTPSTIGENLGVSIEHVCLQARLSSTILHSLPEFPRYNKLSQSSPAIHHIHR